MKNRLDTIFWGLLLILAGALALAQQQGRVGVFTEEFWMWAFGALSLVFLVRYLLAGWREWGWLFPTCIFLALAGILRLATLNNNDSWIATPILGAIAIPFLVAFAVDFRKNWWALFPALTCIMSGIAVVFEHVVPEEVIGALFMFAIAIPFLVVYFTNQKNWWALIPGFTMTAIGILVLLTNYLSQWVGAFVTIVIALPFFYVYFKQERSWWALIPAGIMASIGVNILLTAPILGRFAESSIPSGIMFLGWAATFEWLWQQRAKSPTAWARVPALVCVILAAILIVLGSLNQYGMIIALILGGGYLIYRGIRPRNEISK